MRALITAKAKFPLPMEQAAGLLQGFAAWREHYRGQMESFYFFAAGNGGCGVVNADETAVFEMMASWPFAPFSEIELHPLLDGDQALKMFGEIMQQMMSAAGGQA